jgi:hypothetical protein
VANSGRHLTFPADEAVGLLEWPGSQAAGPVLAVGDVLVPRVGVMLDVCFTESEQSADWLSGARAGTDGEGDRLSGHQQRRPAATRSDRAVNLGFLRRLPEDSIEGLRLRWPIVPDSFGAVTHLEPGLRRLYLGETQLGDDVLPQVAALRHLTYLQSWGNCFSDQGVQQLGALTALEYLYLEELTLSAAAFHFVTGLPRLRGIGLQDVAMTLAEKAALRDLLPGVVVSPD